MGWIAEFDSVFFISIGTILVGIVGLAIKVCVKSRCEHLSLCCGAIVVDRRVDLEAQEEMKHIELGDRKESEEKIDIKIPNNFSPKK